MKKFILNILTRFFDDNNLNLPSNINDIVEFCYEELLNSPKDFEDRNEPLNYSKQDVLNAFQQWIETQAQWQQK